MIGLGRLWEFRHRPALARMTDRFRVAAVYDQVARRADVEAARLGCSAVEGISALIERPDVDAIYLLAPQWFSLHPIPLACALKKPIYCGVPFVANPDALDEAAHVVRESGTPFMPELARRFYPATLRLMELLATRLGPAHWIAGHCRVNGQDRFGPPGPSVQTAPAPLRLDPGAPLADWCRYVFQAADPLEESGTAFKFEFREADGSPEYATFSAQFDDDGVARIDASRRSSDPWGDAGAAPPERGLTVHAEKGSAWLDPPDRIRWTDGQGVHDETFVAEPGVGERLNEQFLRLVLDGDSQGPTLRDAEIARNLVGRLIERDKDGVE